MSQLHSRGDIIYNIYMRNRKSNRSENRKEESKANRNVQTTLRVPKLLYEQAKLFVESGKANSVNELIVRALAAYAKAMERKAIDEAFRPMAKDTQYKREATRIAEQFAASDAESLDLGEREMNEA